MSHHELVVELRFGQPFPYERRPVVGELQQELGFELREIDITGDPELEAVYREWLPVVEIDGRRRFTYHVQPDAFRRAVAQAGQ